MDVMQNIYGHKCFFFFHFSYSKASLIMNHKEISFGYHFPVETHSF